jgi:hypothetical protein
MTARQWNACGNEGGQGLGEGLGREVKLPVAACHGEFANGGTRSLVT